MRISTIDHVVLNVADAERSLQWYQDVLGLDPVRVDEWRAGTAPFPSLRVNDHFIIDVFTGSRTGVNMNHLCLVADRVDVESLLTDDRVEVVDGPGTRFGARGDGWSVYVLDPDGNVLEIRSYD